MTDLYIGFSHNSTLAKSEPSWGSVDKGKLPHGAFARKGEADKKSTWGFPHHWVQNGGGENAMGVYTTGTMYLHKGGLNAAWSAANGGRSGQKAEAAVLSHLRRHFSALGITHTALQRITDTNLEALEQELLDAGVLKPEYLIPNIEAAVAIAAGNWDYLQCDCAHWDD